MAWPDEELAKRRAHRKSVTEYVKRNLEAGLCALCPKKRAEGSKRYCSGHLLKECRRHRDKKDRMEAQRANQDFHG